MELLKDDESAYVRKDLTPFGFSKPTNIILENFIHTSSVIMGQELEFSFDIKTWETPYRIYYGVFEKK